MKRYIISVTVIICSFCMIYSQSFDKLNKKALEYCNKGDYPAAGEFAEKAKIQAEYEFGAESKEYASSLESLGIIYEKMGNYEKEGQLLEECMDIRRKTSAPYEDDYLKSLVSLLKFYMNLGIYAKAEPLVLDFLETNRRILETDNSTYSDILNSLGDLYLKMGRYEKAEVSFIEAAALRKKEFGTSHPYYAASLKGLASAYAQMGNYLKAEKLYTEAISIMRGTLGPNDPVYASGLINLASLYESMGLYEKAMALCTEALEIFSKLASSNRHDYGAALNTLATINQKMGNYKEAEKLFIEASSIIKEISGSSHPDYASFINNLALLYNDMGFYEKAEPLYKEASAIFKKTLGPDSQNYGNSLNNLALLYYRIGNFAEAEPLFTESLSISMKAPGESHLAYANSLINMGSLYMATGNYRKAEKLLSDGADIIKNELGPDNPDYASSLNLLAELYFKMGNYSGAEPKFTEVLKIREKVLEKNHPDYATSLRNLSLLYIASNNYPEAEKLCKEAINITKEAVGTSHPEYAACLNNLAVTYSKTGRYPEAESLYTEASDILEKAFGPDHPSYVSSILNLALLYCETDNYLKAEPVFIKANINLNNQISKNFMFMSEKEKEQFLENNINSFIKVCNSFFLKRNEQNPSVDSLVYNNELAHKGMLLQSNTALRKAVYGTSESALIKAYDNFIDIHKKLSALYSIALADRMGNTDSLEIVANKLEKELIFMGRKVPGIENLTGIAKTTWQDVQKALKQGEAAIEFLDFNYYNKKWTDSTFYCALVLRKEYQYPRLILLFEEKQLQKLLLTQDGGNDYNYIEKFYRSKPDRHGNDNPIFSHSRLYNLIWEPFDSLLKDINTIYLSPSGLLNRISFNAISMTDSLLLIDKYNLKIVSSTRIIGRSDNSPVSLLDNSRAAIYGGIEYDLDSAEMVALKGKYTKQGYNLLASRSVTIPEDTRGVRWSYLPGTLTEASEIQRLLNSRNIPNFLFTGKNATEDSFKYLTENVKSPEIIHIATHGFFFGAGSPEMAKAEKEIFRGRIQSRTTFIYSDNPLLRSGILFAGSNRAWKNAQPLPGIEDGVLTAFEVSNIDLHNTELVVLSACETGLGEIRGSEGVYGLQRAFKMAGVKYIVMSLWKIPDDQTSELMQLFYSDCMNGMPISDAFKSAQQAMRKKYDPFYWAGFVLIE